MAKSVFHFGEPQAGLLGTLQEPVRLRRRSTGVLLCNPLGEEASRAHRLYRVLATQLERQGYSSFRFDYRCSGDSAGEEADATLGMWVQDIEEAAAELARRTSVTRLALVGVRLGATLAAMACAAGQLRVRQLGLWDPAIDGRAQLAEMAAVHASYSREEYPRSRDGGAACVAADEYLGLLIGTALREQISAIDLAGLDLPADRVTVVRTRTDPEATRLQAAWQSRPGHSFIDVAGGHNWNSDAALNAATVPAGIVRTIVESIEEHCP